MNTDTSWRDAFLDGLRSGAAASLLSTAALTLCGWIERRRPAAPSNGPSQWLWGEREAYERRFTFRHTVAGYAVHHVSSILWATLHQKRVGRIARPRPLSTNLAQGLATAGCAAFVDYCLTPRRLQPGFDKHLGKRSIAVVYAAFGLGLGLAQAQAQAPVVPAAASPRDDGNWTMAAKDYANTRFSELTEINTSNVKNLEVAFTFSTETLKGQESAVLAVDGTIYFTTPYPNYLFAIDLSRPGGALKWKFDPRPDASAQGSACCQPINRGPVYSNGTLYYNTIDAHTFAIDAATGKVKWKVKVGDFTRGETTNMAPLLVRDKVLVGNSGAEFGVRGWLTALNIADGSEAWRAYTTGPDKDVLIDPAEFRPFYPQYKGKDLGVTQWPGEHWKIGGGTVWGWISYDPALNLIYHGTSNPSPWNHEVRPGDNNWTEGVFARNPDTGKARWFYQYSPHGLWDHSAVNEHLVLDVKWRDRTRKVLVHPERNGYMYVIDRESGEVLAADPYVHITASKGVDLKSGRLIENPAKRPVQGRVIRDVCPNSPGAKDWNPSAFSKQTGLLYVPHNNLCMDWQTKPVNYIKGTPYIGVNPRFYPGPGGNAGEFMAWDIVNRRKVWTIPERWPVWSGAAATAGGVIFYGNLEGWFKAVDARTGALLWQFKCASGIIGQPTTWKGPDGRQYVAILSGIGGWVGAMVSSQLDPRDPTAAKGFGNMTGDLKKQTASAGILYVFALPR